MFPQEICHQSWLLSDSSCDLLASLTDVIYFSSYKRNASFFTYSPHNRTLAYQSFLPFFPSKTTDGRFHRLMNNPAWIVPGGLSSYFLMSPDICRSRPQLSPLFLIFFLLSFLKRLSRCSMKLPPGDLCFDVSIVPPLKITLYVHL